MVLYASLLFIRVATLSIVPWLVVLPSGHLSSNHATTRADALNLVKALASQCSDSGPVKDMAKQLFVALKGKHIIDTHHP